MLVGVKVNIKKGCYISQHSGYFLPTYSSTYIYITQYYIFATFSLDAYASYSIRPISASGGVVTNCTFIIHRYMYGASYMHYIHVSMYINDELYIIYGTQTSLDLTRKFSFQLAIISSIMHSPTVKSLMDYPSLSLFLVRIQAVTRRKRKFSIN